MKNKSHNNPVSRRSFMRMTAAGVGLGALPYMSLFHSLRAEAAGTQKKRLVLYVTGNGVGDAVWERTRNSTTDFTLPEPVAPLQPYKDDLTLIQGLGCGYSEGLHGNGYATLSMQPEPGNDFNRPGGATFDRMMAKAIGSQDLFPSIALAYLYKISSKRIAYCMSADGKDQVFPAEWNPTKAHEKLFASISADPGAQASAKLALEQKRSVLDFARQDSATLQAKLGGYERQKLEQFETSLREMELRLEKSANATPSTTCGNYPKPSKYQTTAQVETVIHDDLVRSYVDLSLHAMMCGLTRVAHISVGGGFSGHSKYKFLGDTKGPHKLWHEYNNAGSIPMLKKIFRSDFEQIAYLWGELKKIPEGNGSMADNTLVMWINTGGRGHHRGYKSGHNIVLLGNPGGKLNTKQDLVFDKNDHTLADMYVSVAQALDHPITSFGNASANRGPLPGLLV